MGNKFLKTRLKRIYPLLVLEDVISHETRVFLKKILGAVALLFFVAALFYKGEYLSQVKGAFSLFGFLWLWLILIEAYFYSHYENAKNMDKKVPFEIARLLYYSEEGDLTKGFLFSDLGDEVMKRLEFDEKEIKEFLHDRESVLLSLENLLTDDFDFKEYIESVYESDEALQALLMKKNLQFKDFLGAFLWVLQKFEDRIEQERFWSLERLSRIEGIGKNWSYGETYVLDRYGEDVTERGSSHLEGYQSMHTETVAKLESVLCKSHGANALVVSEDEASRMDIVTMLARQIKDGEALAPLAKERVYVINTNLLIEGASDKISFEREFQNVLVQAMKALNVIVVIPYFSVFLKSAETLGSDALSIMRPFFLSPVLHIIALDSKEAYQNHLSQNSSIMENFEVIHAELSDERGALIMLQEEAQKIESESRFFFSYPALVAICEGAKRYFDAYSFADKARDLLLEAVPFAATKGSHRICRSHISALIESKTGVPTEAPKGKEKEMLLNLEEMLHSRVVGQDEAVKAISAALKRSRAGVRNPDKPIGSFLFLGPTGVGKTETTKAL
ncbi:MAG TPA: hypothetical protein VEC13_02245, partial [Candidatus Paceibacterota bacterium]|nr:hypothetical protein [Candidatus Paceibacterota bacterium]